MIISQTPYRISFFGGGTDYPDWYLQNGGQVLSTTIDKYIYISCRYLPPFFDHKLRLAYSKVEICQSADELEHPAVRETLMYLGKLDGLEIHYDGDLPSRSGMGSSSAFTVGLIKALKGLEKKGIDPHQLCLDAIHIEQERLGESVGSQDQVNAAYGGFNNIVFHKSGEIEVRSLDVSRERIDQLNGNLMLFYTGIMRTAETVSVTYAKNTTNKRAQLEKLYDLVDEGIKIVKSDSSFDHFGELLHECWVEKRGLSSMVSNTRVDKIYQDARAAGALGGKLCGAGGGGMMLFYVPRDRQQEVRETLSHLFYVPIKFSNLGSRIIFTSKQEDYDDETLTQFSKIDKFVEMTEI
jgi:D-glycero-alpha-D-manno-heptose-7-phosphate kinase